MPNVPQYIQMLSLKNIALYMLWLWIYGDFMTIYGNLTLYDYKSFKGPDHLQKNLFKKNHKSFAMPKKISET